MSKEKKLYVNLNHVFNYIFTFDHFILYILYFKENYLWSYELAILFESIKSFKSYS